jgi:4-amino-4-deoxy-L-arabinose transferase-like glycosyltransferase
MWARARALLPRNAIVWLIFGGAAVRSTMAALDYSIYFPDEIFQSLEPAHRFAFGYGVQAWEFIDKARSWLFPGVLGCWMWVLSKLGVGAAHHLVLGVKLLLVAASLPGLWASMRFAEHRAGRGAAILAGLLGITYPLLCILAYRPLSEPISASIWMVVAYVLFGRSRHDGAGGRLFAAGILAGLGVFVRYQSGLLLVLSGLGLLARREWRAFFLFAAGAALAGMFGGFLDWVTWGSPYISFWRYIEFNLIEQGAAVWGIHASDHYWRYLVRSTGIVEAVLLGIGLLAGVRRAPSLAIFSLVFYLAHVQVPHKELRFLVPAVPMALTLAAIGWGEIARWAARGIPTRSAPALLGVGLAASFAWRTARLTYGDTGLGVANEHRIFQAFQSVNLAMSRVGQRRDVCGVIVKTLDLVSQGGYTFLHRDVPLVFKDTGHTRKFANYVIAGDRVPVGQQYFLVRRVGDMAIYRRRGDCEVPVDWLPAVASHRPSLEEIERAEEMFLRELARQGKTPGLW